MLPEVVRQYVFDAEPREVANNALAVLLEMGASLKRFSPEYPEYIVAEHGSHIVWDFDPKKEKKKVTVQVRPLEKKALLEVRIDYSSVYMSNLIITILIFVASITLFILGAIAFARASELESIREVGFLIILGRKPEELREAGLLAFIVGGLTAILGVAVAAYFSRLHASMGEFADEIIYRVYTRITRKPESPTDSPVVL